MHKVMCKRELMVRDVHCNIVVNVLEHTINCLYTQQHSSNNLDRGPCASVREWMNRYDTIMLYNCSAVKNK